MRNNFSIFLKIAAIAFLLSGCVTRTPSTTTEIPNTASWEEHQRLVSTLQNYQARGKFAHIMANKSDSANFSWFQNGSEHYRLLLNTPFGNRIVELNVRSHQSQLTDHLNRVYFNTKPELLIQQLTGLQIPVDNLRNWLVGLPGKSTQYTLTNDNLLQQITLNESGNNWKVHYLKYDYTNQPPLPKELELTQGDQKIKIAIYGWTLQ